MGTESLTQDPTIFYSLAGGTIALLALVVWLATGLFKRRREVRGLIAEQSVVRGELDELRDHRDRLAADSETSRAELSSTRADLDHRTRELDMLRREHETLAAAQQAHEAERARMLGDIHELERTVGEFQRREAAARQDREILQATMREAALGAKEVAESRAELVSRSKSIAVTMKELLVDLNAWVRAVDEMAGIQSGDIDERTMRLRQNIQRAFDEYVDTNGRARANGV